MEKICNCTQSVSDLRIIILHMHMILVFLEVRNWALLLPLVFFYRVTDQDDRKMIENKENQKRTDQKNVIQRTRVKTAEKGLVCELLITIIKAFARTDLVPKIVIFKSCFGIVFWRNK